MGKFVLKWVSLRERGDYEYDFTSKGATIATRVSSKWGGVIIKLSGLSPCLLYSVFFLTV